MVDFNTEQPITLDNGMVSISFSVTDGGHTLTDAIVVPQNQYADMDMTAEQQRRWDNWIAAIHPPEEIVNG